MPLCFERLDLARHDRTTFSCGEDSLDTYLRRQAGQDARRKLAVCYVLCEQGSRTIIGYYTLSAFSVEPAALPADLAAQLPSYDRLPAALLGRLAVASAYQGQGMSERLLLDAIRRASSADLAAMALVVDALTDRLVQFYTSGYGFIPFADAPRRLFLPLGQFRGRFSAPFTSRP